jgi:hypothetical protein
MYAPGRHSISQDQRRPQVHRAEKVKSVPAMVCLYDYDIGIYCHESFAKHEPVIFVIINNYNQRGGFHLILTYIAG